MKLWLIRQASITGYDTFDSAVVAAPSAEAARLVHPFGGLEWSEEKGHWYDKYGSPSGWDVWSKPDAVTVEYLGEAAPHIQAGVILGSFNAG